MQRQLARHLGTGMKIRIERNRPSNPRLNGYLLGLSEHLGLMHCFHDFMPDGYTVFRVSDVEKVRCGKYDRQFHEILSGEGLLEGLKVPLNLDLTGVRTAIETISEQFGLMIVECEEQDEEEEDFYIGKVASVDDDRLRFFHFDALGMWRKRASSIPCDEITLLQFETPYIQIFSRYLKNAPSG
jgi:hypothetical protein